MGIFNGIHKQRPGERSGGIVVTGVLLALLMLALVGVSSVSAQTTASVKEACVRAGTATPPRFSTQVRYSRTRTHEQLIVWPVGYADYEFAAMPSECDGRYWRIAQIKFRYLDTRARSWATVKINYFSGHWEKLHGGATGNSSTKGLIGGFWKGTGYPPNVKRLGCLRRARYFLKLQVKNLRTKRIVSQRVVSKSSPIKYPCRR